MPRSTPLRKTNGSLRSKPGRRPTGRTKPLAINCLVNADEDEYIARASYAVGLSKSAFLLRNACSPGWAASLTQLRSTQKNVPGSFRRVP